MKVVLLLILLTSYCSLWGQDSLFKEKVNHYKNNARVAAMSGEFEKALVYADSIAILAQRKQSIRYMLVSKSFKGKICERMGQNKEAYDFFQQALEKLDQIPAKELDESFTINSTKADLYKSIIKLFHRQNLIDSVHVYGDKVHALPCEKGTLWSKDYYVSVLQEQGDLKKAFRICHEILNCYSVSSKDKYLLPKTLVSMANIYIQLGQHEMAIVYIDSSLQIAETIKDSLSMLIAYDQLATEWSAIKNYEVALDWALKCVQIAEKMPKHIAIERVNTIFVKVPLAGSYAHLSTTYKTLNRIDSAKYYANKSLLIHYKSKKYDDISDVLVNIADLIIEEGNNYQAALDSLDKADAIAPKYRYMDWGFLQHNIFLSKGKIYTKLGEIDSALVYYTRAEAKAKELDQENVLVWTYQEMEAFYLNQKDYKKAYDYQILGVEQERRIQDKERQNSILSFEIKYESEKLEQENLLLAKNQEIQEREIVFNKSINQRNSYIILGLIALILLSIGISWLVYRQRYLKTQFKIMTLEQKALKAQINPHFFFNVLNSLQGTILSEKPIVAYKYHSKFTKLMRLVLMQSNSDGILLEEELEALKLYLELEQLRTGNAFDFEVVNTVDFKNEIIVPSMLLQPFAENSIWHGVMNRKENEHKKITIRVHKEANRIVCEIEDTGVGRKEALKIKQQKTKKYESMGMKVTQNRLELFQLRYKTPLRFNIKDLKNRENQVLGTKVNLEIPIINN